MVRVYLSKKKKNASPPALMYVVVRHLYGVKLCTCPYVIDIDSIIGMLVFQLDTLLRKGKEVFIFYEYTWDRNNKLQMNISFEQKHWQARRRIENTDHNFVDYPTDFLLYHRDLFSLLRVQPVFSSSEHWRPQSRVQVLAPTRR